MRILRRHESEVFESVTKGDAVVSWRDDADDSMGPIRIPRYLSTIKADRALGTLKNNLGIGGARDPR